MTPILCLHRKGGFGEGEEPNGEDGFHLDFKGRVGPSGHVQ